MATASPRPNAAGSTAPAGDGDKNTAGKEMTFLEHLEELRWLLFRSACAIAVGMVLAFIYKEFFFDTILFAPRDPNFITYRALCWLGTRSGIDGMCINEMGFSIFSGDISGQFMTHMTVAFTAGLVLAFPYVLWEIWRFIGPGLKPKEKGAVRGIIGFASFMFVLGIAFGYVVLAPLSVQFFGTYSVSDSVQRIFQLDSYIGIITSVTLWTGIVFQMPLVVIFLTRIGIAGPGFLRTYRKHGYVVVFVLAAIVTPPDVVSQLLVGLPLILLYEISILLSARTQRQMERKRAEEDAPPANAAKVA
ncbi:MAG: twin-arginine translocase subunit TatC [Flavobacteriales bacterium]